MVHLLFLLSGLVTGMVSGYIFKTMRAMKSEQQKLAINSEAFMRKIRALEEERDKLDKSNEALRREVAKYVEEELEASENWGGDVVR